MALPLDQSIQRFISNDERMNTFANGNSAATYTTNTGEVVPSIQKFLSDKSAEVDANLNLSSPLPIGDVTPNSGAFTSLRVSSGIAMGAAPQTGNTGEIGFPNAAALRWRNGANNAYLNLMYLDPSNNQILGGSAVNTVVASVTGVGTVGTFSSTGLAVTGALRATKSTQSLQGYASDLAYKIDGNGLWGQKNLIGHYYTGARDATRIAVPSATSNTAFTDLDAAGNLGLGVTPSAWSVGKAIEVGNAGNGFLTVSGIENYVLSNTVFNAGWKYATTNPASCYSQYNGAHIWKTAPSGTAGDPITFTQSMTLDAYGGLWLNQTGGGLANSNSIALQPGDGYQVTNHFTGTASGTRYLYLGYAGSEIGSITQSGTTAVAYNTTSDHRLKENVRDADAARFMDIKFRDFEWIDGRHDCGVIAHELQQVYPDLVLGEKDATEVRTVEITPAVPAVLDEEGGEITPAVPAVTEEQTFPVYQQVNYIGLIGRMGTRVQSQQRTIDAQAALIEAMEARLSTLEAAGGSK